MGRHCERSERIIYIKIFHYSYLCTCINMKIGISMITYTAIKENKIFSIQFIKNLLNSLVSFNEILDRSTLLDVTANKKYNIQIS